MSGWGFIHIIIVHMYYERLLAQEAIHCITSIIILTCDFVQQCLRLQLKFNDLQMTIDMNQRVEEETAQVYGLMNDLQRQKLDPTMSIKRGGSPEFTMAAAFGSVQLCSYIWTLVANKNTLLATFLKLTISSYGCYTYYSEGCCSLFRTFPSIICSHKALLEL